MVSIKNSLFQGVFQNMNRCSIWWLFVPRVCNGVGIIVTKNWIESLLTVPIWDRKTFATERDRKFPNAGYACPLDRNSPSLVNHSYMRLDNQRQVQRGRRVPDAPKYIRQTRWFLLLKYWADCYEIEITPETLTGPDLWSRALPKCAKADNGCRKEFLWKSYVVH